MFRFIKFAAIGAMFLTSSAFAHGHHGYHGYGGYGYGGYGYAYRPYYGVYAPVAGYYPRPQPYYAPSPASAMQPYYGYGQQAPNYGGYR